MDTTLIPLFVVIGVYGATAAVLTKAIRMTVKRKCPRLANAIDSSEIVKRGIPILVAGGLLAVSKPSVFALFGLMLNADDDLLSVKSVLAVFSGVFSGWGYHWITDVWKGRQSVTGASQSTVADGSSTDTGESDVL